jgi:hypothetical protein
MLGKAKKSIIVCARRTVTNIISEYHDWNYALVPNPILRASVAQCNLQLDVWTHIFPQPIFIFIAFMTYTHLTYLPNLLTLGPFILVNRMSTFLLASVGTYCIFLTARGLQVPNLFLCIFLLFAVRIVASLGAVCMRSEKNYARDRADPL